MDVHQATVDPNWLEGWFEDDDGGWTFFRRPKELCRGVPEFLCTIHLRTEAVSSRKCGMHQVSVPDIEKSIHEARGREKCKSIQTKKTMRCGVMVILSPQASATRCAPEFQACSQEQQLAPMSDADVTEDQSAEETRQMG